MNSARESPAISAARPWLMRRISYHFTAAASRSSRVNVSGSWDGDVQQPIQRHAILRDQFAQRRALNQLHREEVRALGLFHRMDRDDVRMIQRGGGACFLLETAQAISVDAEGGRQDLDGDFPAEPWIMRAIHLAL